LNSFLGWGQSAYNGWVPPRTLAGRPRSVHALRLPHLANERRLLSALTDAEQRRLADLLRKLRLGLPPL